MPVVTTLDTEEPLMLPMRPEATTEVSAGPPRRRPVRARASWMKKLPAPSLSRKAPKMMNTTTKVADTRDGYAEHALGGPTPGSSPGDGGCNPCGPACRACRGPACRRPKRPRPPTQWACPPCAGCPPNKHHQHPAHPDFQIGGTHDARSSTASGTKDWMKKTATAIMPRLMIQSIMPGLAPPRPATAR